MNRPTLKKRSPYPKTPNVRPLHTPAVNRRLLAAAGFEAVRDEMVTMREPEGEATLQWVICRAV